MLLTAISHLFTSMLLTDVVRCKIFATHHHTIDLHIQFPPHRIQMSQNMIDVSTEPKTISHLTSNLQLLVGPALCCSSSTRSLFKPAPY